MGREGGSSLLILIKREGFALALCCNFFGPDLLGKEFALLSYSLIVQIPLSSNLRSLHPCILSKFYRNLVDKVVCYLSY